MPLAASSRSRSRSRHTAVNYWPGFVDALAALLMVIVFVVVVFALAQFFLSETLSGREVALDRLNRQVGELTSLLGLERSANADLRLSMAQISAELQDSVAVREELEPQVAALNRNNRVLVSARDALRLRLQDVEEELADLNADRNSIADDLQDARQTITAGRDTIELQVRELESLRRDITALRTVRAELEAETASLAQRLGISTEAAAQERDRRAELEARLADIEDQTILVQTELAEREIRLAELLGRAETAETSLAGERELAAAAEDELDLLNTQLAVIRQQLAALNNSLVASEERNEEQQTMIVDLGNRLNVALASRVQELANYRSEFFGRLRELIGDRSDIRIVGDRFVFQSEVLFSSGSSELEDGGKVQLLQLASTLRDIVPTIPDDIDWVLRIDGHTDIRPIHTDEFPSNWELSTARATSVLKFMLQAGIQPNRVVAAGFGQYHPLDQRRDEAAFRRNRRIEFKLTQR